MNNLIASSKKQRDYLFDNYKAFLIFLVVTGHFIEPCANNTEFLNLLKWVIVSFHMPAFIFISGYFSKRKLSFSSLIQKLLVPYLVYEVIYYFYYVLILHKETKLYLLYPKFTLWYLLALFAWRAVTPYFKKIPHHMLLAVILGLLIGCSDMKNNYLSLPRILYFYPFFLAGIHFDKESVAKLRTKPMRIASVTGLLLILICFICSPLRSMYSDKIFYGRYNYASLHQSIPEGILCRILCYCVGFFITLAILSLLYGKKTQVSYIGERTMAIYIFHGLTYSYFKECTDILKNVDTPLETLLLLGACLLITLLFSAKPFTILTSVPEGRFF